MNPSPADSFLHAFHGEYPGATTQILARGRSPAGSTYEVLAAEAPQARSGLPIIDLACGDGFLLDLLRRGWPDRALLGLDMSAAELRLARRRLGPAVPLVQGHAGRLPLAGGSAGAIFCHEALMLMTPLEAVVAELARVLAPGGRFAAVGPGTIPGGPVITAFGGVLGGLIAETGRLPPDLGDPRAHTAAPLQELFAATGHFTPLEATEMIVELDGTAAEVTAFFASSYNVFALGDARPLFEERLSAALAPLADADGRIPFALPATLFRCKRLGDGQ
jgi:SAM-dependent methyltransferase